MQRMRQSQPTAVCHFVTVWYMSFDLRPLQRHAQRQARLHRAHEVAASADG
jgi:hypothetical protein